MPKKPKRVLVYVSFEVEREALPSKADLEAAFEGAINGIVREGEHYYAGKLGMKFTGRRRP